jgi:hypothetical protein
MRVATGKTRPGSYPSRTSPVNDEKRPWSAYNAGPHEEGA